MIDEDVRDALAIAQSDAPKGSLWLHVKSGHSYRILGHVLIEATQEPRILYASEGDRWDVIWARPAEEFLDGRFQRSEKQSTGGRTECR